ncbi:DUF6712 family protein [Altibacter sp. HG106]|uniref:DUF6712 family protein n=1 Tax=Altibacter sp. HG106 TaxID=3023937 RepID=UPI0023509198|nr:DUF6712 family protein [Altibacter sp. HG106]MDC7994470.1 hypothetical protein [Altibacter sp. HG106]
MELLFKKNQNDSACDALKEALSFIDADFTFSKMQSDLRSATVRLLEFVGQDVYNELIAVAGDDDPSADDKEYLRLARSVIANDAYRLFAPANDLQHGNNGRTMLSSEDNKTPFEHMLIASNDELARRSHRAMDDLIRYLDKESNTWKESDQYKASHKLFVRTMAEFEAYYEIGSRLLLKKLGPGIAKAEIQLVLPRIGRELFDSLKEKRKGAADNTFTDQEKELFPLIQGVCVFYSLSWGIPRLQGTLFPEGMLQPVRGDRATIKGRLPHQGNQIEQMSQLFKTDVKDLLVDLEEVIKKYKEDDQVEESDEIIDTDHLIPFDEDDLSVTT